MKWNGGYSVNLKGRPGAQIIVPAEERSLTIPLAAGRLHYTTVAVKDGQEVAQGSVLAIDPGNFYVPLIAPRSGRVNFGVSGNIVLENCKTAPGKYSDQDAELLHIGRTIDAGGKIRYKLLKQGAWHYFTDVFTGKVPDPLAVPQAVVISTVHLEPFAARGDVLLKDRLANFKRGLEHLQTLLEYQPMYLVFPRVQSSFAQTVRDALRGYAWVRLFEIPLTYPFDDFKLLARKMGLSPDPGKGSVWGLRTEGVLAVDTVLTGALAVTDRTIAVGGSGVSKPTHFKVPAGYPIQKLVEYAQAAPQTRVIAGGVFSGKTVDGAQAGLDNETSGLTVIPDVSPRQFLKFLWPGLERRSYSRCFLSALRPPFTEAINTGLCGEGRACIACGFCVDVCPARIAPRMFHKLMYQDNIDEAALFRPDLCIGCGLCTYVCPSKINLSGEIALLNRKLEDDLKPQKSGASA
ncbi:MAG: 4Fe-4S dicluster domain-containing protein [Chitinivibrionales bacterium]|nr:4Fe-4S dicluster domain-containing protein [Chitinivibrionales bacterium]